MIPFPYVIEIISSILQQHRFTSNNTLGALTKLHKAIRTNLTPSLHQGHHSSSIHDHLISSPSPATFLSSPSYYHNTPCFLTRYTTSLRSPIHQIHTNHITNLHRLVYDYMLEHKIFFFCFLVATYNTTIYKTTTFF